MAAVVNHLHFKEPVNRALFADSAQELAEQMREIDGFGSFHIVQTSDYDLILVIIADTTATLDQLATEVGSPWMQANVVPLLSGPPERYIGPVIASSES